MGLNDQFELVYFGDSLTDDGNTYDLTSETLHTAYPPLTYGYAQKFTNGDTYAQVAADALGATSYSNYAFGGAEAVGSQTIERYVQESGLENDVKDESLFDYDINLAAQVERFLADTAGQDLSGLTASILIGANDYRNFAPTTNDPNKTYLEAMTLIQNVVTSTISAAMTLLQSGVGTVLINTLPPADFFPFIEQLPPVLQDLSRQGFAMQNQALEAAVAGLAAQGADIRIVDLEAMSTEILLDPSTFGFVAPLADSVLIDMNGNPVASGFDPDQVAFFDEVHLTDAGHAIWGMFQAANLTHTVTFGSFGADHINGTDSDDLVLASSDDDTVSLMQGNDVGIGGLGNDTMSGGNGNDIVAGGSGDDVLDGGNGDDFLAGGNGDDEIYGGNGNDVLVDGLGSDMLFGGKGSDIFLFAENELIGGAATDDDLDIFDGGHGHDILYLALTADSRSAVEDAVSGGASFEDALACIGLLITGIEEVAFVDSRMDLADVEASANIEDADLWGFI